MLTELRVYNLIGLNMPIKVIEIPNWGQQFIQDAFNEKFREAAVQAAHQQQQGGQGLVGVKQNEGE